MFKYTTAAAESYCKGHMIYNVLFCICTELHKKRLCVPCLDISITNL